MRVLAACGGSPSLRPLHRKAMSGLLFLLLFVANLLTTIFLFAKIENEEYFLCSFNLNLSFLKKIMNKELVDYIKQQLSLSVSKNKITEILLEQGWHQAEIDEAFLDAEGGAIRAAQEISGGGESNDYSRNDSAGGKKLLLFAGLGALAMLIVAAMAVSLSGKSGDDDKKQAVLPVQNAPEVSETPAVEQESPAVEENQVDPALLAEISKLEKTIVPPAGWTSRQGTVSYRPLAVFFKPEFEKDATGKNVFNENISVVRDGLLNGQAEYIAKAKAALSGKMSDYKILSDRKVNLADGSPATLIGGSFTQNGLAMKNMQLYAFENNNVYIITGVTLAQNWDAEKDMIGAAVMSFKFPKN